MSLKPIQSINFFNDQITILFEQNWFQEDIVSLRRLLLDKVPDHILKEITLGADRENVRFQWLNTDFILNFDFYSQSCWISAHDEVSITKIQPLFNLIRE